MAAAKKSLSPRSLRDSQARETTDENRTEIVLVLEDRPGALADVGEIIGGAGANIVAAAAVALQGKGVVRFVVDDSEAALAALKRAGVPVEGVREVMAVTLEDRPGELGRYARNLADAGVNISALYLGGQRGGERELIVALDDRKPKNRSR